VGLPRKPAWERILRMATEMGVASFHPFVAARSVARGEHLQRWERVVESAAQQCGRGDIPRVHGLQKLHAMELPAHRLAMAPGGDAVERPSEATALLIGPEGGLVEGELEGWTRAGLGPTVLRADTAAVAALALYSPTR
jgi:16S rRNA (uracil1498-N3)-methyltransferase